MLPVTVSLNADITMRSVVLCIVWIAICDCQVIRNNVKTNATDEESDLGFPEHDKIDVDRTSTRVPLYIPGKCPDNQLLYPGNQKTDWICDCRPGYLYYPPKDGCFAAFRQGPCPNNQYMILPKGEFNPTCRNNPCRQDGFVLFAGLCYELNKAEGPCEPVTQGGGIFGVNSTTLEVGCLLGTDRLSIIGAPNICPPGSQRDRTNRCKKKF